MKNLDVLVVGMALGCPSIVTAQDVAVPHAFQAGTPARASEVNENFSALADAISHPGKRPPYRFVGFTAAPLDGNVGHQAMHEACQAALNNPDARLATSKEILETPDLPPFETPNGIPVPAAWVQPVIVGYSSPDVPVDLSGYSIAGQGALSCRAWSTAAANPWGGLLWVPPGSFGSGQCQFARFAACSAPDQE